FFGFGSERGPAPAGFRAGGIATAASLLPAGSLLGVGSLFCAGFAAITGDGTPGLGGGGVGAGPAARGLAFALMVGSVPLTLASSATVLALPIDEIGSSSPSSATVAA